MFKDFFKPLKKRDAKIAAVLFGIVLIIFAVNLIKDVISGKYFEELHSSIMLIAFFAIIEWGMVVIATSKDKEGNAESEDASPETDEAMLEGSEDYTEGLSEEFEGYSGDESGDAGDDAGAEGGGGEAG